MERVNSAGKAKGPKLEVFFNAWLVSCIVAFCMLTVTMIREHSHQVKLHECLTSKGIADPIIEPETESPAFEGTIEQERDHFKGEVARLKEVTADLQRLVAKAQTDKVRLAMQTKDQEEENQALKEKLQVKVQERDGARQKSTPGTAKKKTKKPGKRSKLLS
ncbi:hypothetical protein CYMTET_19286 [Cymbomonas tetramitiformis]|uniref:Uncharacterized protein n=1 Tax=Cymbomonas tetramitiformis TaxID=36881 RepID=A0AAE0L542_9CHLO|nr:hypothetical protein CYMTET_19286 [Cymbomonas tetramitiformis]